MIKFKLILFLLVGGCFSVQVNAQKQYNQKENIWDIISPFLREKGEVSSFQLFLDRPIVDAEGSITSTLLRDASIDALILDPNYTLPITNDLTIYKFSVWKGHPFYFILLVKDGHWAIIDTHQPFYKIMAQVIDYNKSFITGPVEELYLYQHVLQTITWNSDNMNGSRIRMNKPLVVQQEAHANIWDVTSGFLRETGDSLSDGFKDRPEVVPGGILYSTVIRNLTHDNLVKSIDFELPVSTDLIVYRFSEFKPKPFYYLMLLVDGYWSIIDMRRSLPEIVEQVAFFEKRNLFYENRVQLYQTVLDTYRMNYERTNGNPIFQEAGMKRND